MIDFETSGQLRHRDGYRFQVCEDFWIMTPIRGISARFKNRLQLDLDGKLHIFDGWAWDGASFKLLWQTKSSRRASCVHDAGYLLCREGLIGPEHKKTFDKLFLDLGKFDGMWTPRIRLWFKAVGWFGLSASRRQERGEMLAP